MAGKPGPARLFFRYYDSRFRGRHRPKYGCGATVCRFRRRRPEARGPPAVKGRSVLESALASPFEEISSAPVRSRMSLARLTQSESSQWTETDSTLPDQPLIAFGLVFGYAHSDQGAHEASHHTSCPDAGQGAHDGPRGDKGPTPGIAIVPIPARTPRVPPITAPVPAPAAAAVRLRQGATYGPTV